MTYSRPLFYSLFWIFILSLGACQSAPKFSSETAAIDPTEAFSAYQVAPGDELSIDVFGEPDFGLKAQVGKLGTIVYPVLGEIKVSGLTVAQVKSLVEEGLSGDYLLNPRITVVITEYRKFFVDGQVKSPGGYAYIPGLNVQKAISLAGGFAPLAAQSKIYLTRENDPARNRVRVDLQTEVQPGDVLTVDESLF